MPTVIDLRGGANNLGRALAGLGAGIGGIINPNQEFQKRFQEALAANPELASQLAANPELLENLPIKKSMREAILATPLPAGILFDRNLTQAMQGFTDEQKAVVGKFQVARAVGTTPQQVATLEQQLKALGDVPQELFDVGAQKDVAGDLTIGQVALSKFQADQVARAQTFVDQLEPDEAARASARGLVPGAFVEEDRKTEFGMRKDLANINFENQVELTELRAENAKQLEQMRQAGADQRQIQSSNDAFIRQQLQFQENLQREVRQAEAQSEQLKDRTAIGWQERTKVGTIAAWRNYLYNPVAAAAARAGTGPSDAQAVHKAFVEAGAAEQASHLASLSKAATDLVAKVQDTSLDNNARRFYAAQLNTTMEALNVASGGRFPVMQVKPSGALGKNILFQDAEGENIDLNEVISAFENPLGGAAAPITDVTAPAQQPQAQPTAFDPQRVNRAGLSAGAQQALDIILSGVEGATFEELQRARPQIAAELLGAIQ